MTPKSCQKSGRPGRAQEVFGTFQAAEILGVTQRTVLQWIHKGLLAAGQVDGSYRIAREAIDKFKANLKGSAQ